MALCHKFSIWLLAMALSSEKLYYIDKIIISIVSIYRKYIFAFIKLQTMKIFYIFFQDIRIYKKISTYF